ncbi:MAG: prolipoprotein diacylglyceryl transferase family protein [Polyangiaceae bacterium]
MHAAHRITDAVGSVAAERLLSPWGAFQVLAVALAWAWFWRRTPGDLRRLRPCVIVALGGAALGAVMLGPLLGIPACLATGRCSAPSFQQITAYGALAGLCAGLALLDRLRGVRGGRALDALAPCLGLLVCVARMGCFVAGCDFGAPTQVPWAVRYPPGTPAFGWHRDAGWIAASAPSSLSVHPTQLYEAALGLVVCGVVLAAEHARRARALVPDARAAGGRSGTLFAAAAVTYAVGRAAIDLVRGDGAATTWPTTAQCLGVVLVAGVVLWMTGRQGQGRRNTPELDIDAPCS